MQCLEIGENIEAIFTRQRTQNFRPAEKCHWTIRSNETVQDFRFVHTELTN